MILTDEDIEALRSVDDCGEAAPEFSRIARIAEAEVLRKLRERPADAVLLTYDSGERELRFHNNGWPAAETPLHIIPEVHE